MNMQEIGKVIDRWMEDEAFRKQLRTSPDVAVQKLGLQMTDKDRKIMKSIDWSLTDEQLQSQISKAL